MKRKNSNKESFLKRLPLSTVESDPDCFSAMAFSFKFFDSSQPAGQGFSDWTHGQLVKLLDKLKNYCGSTLGQWQKTTIGKGSSHVLEIYGNFPAKSEFFFPKHVPMDVKWGRFRLESDMRLIGFVLSHEHCMTYHIPANVFYIVFLDQHHKFWCSEQR